MSDNFSTIPYRVKGWDWNDKTGYVYEGPWEPYVRDFDPTLNIRIRPIKNKLRIELPKYGNESFLDFGAAVSDVEDWIISDDKMFQDFPNRLIHKDETGAEWVSLYLYQENRLQPPNEEMPVIGFPVGEQHIWSMASMYIVADKMDKLTEEELISSGFIQSQSSNTRDCYSLFSREYAWSPGYNAEFAISEDDDNRVPINAVPASINVLWEEEYDATKENAISISLPCAKLIEIMHLRQQNADGFYYDTNGTLAAFDTDLTQKINSVVVRKDILDIFLEKIGMKLVWLVDAEKEIHAGDYSISKWSDWEAVFIYERDSIAGEIRRIQK